MSRANGAVVNAEGKEQLDEAATATSKAYQNFRKHKPEEDESPRGAMDELGEKSKEKEEDKKISPEIAAMQPILRFLQLLCENHNRDLQVSTP